MKKKEFITKTIEKLVDVSDMDIVEAFMKDEFLLDDWIDEEPMIEDYEYFWEDYEDLTEEDKERIWKLIVEESNKKFNKARESEAELLKDRKSILNFITDSIDTSYKDEGELGYLLSPEEILDIILENGKK